MDIQTPTALLGGLTPAQFMRRHWQKKPLLVRQAIAGMRPLLDTAQLFDLAGQEGVESRLVVHGRGDTWKMRSGPFARRALPPRKQPGWTLLVQGVDLQHDGVHELLRQFRFVPDARLDDLMVSYASDGGGVGPHFDSYDVFLLQAHGQRRWRIGRQKDLTLQEGVPLKILADFEPEEEYVLDPGDMLYLPPRYAHDGIAVGECMTYSIGFRAPRRGEIAQELLQRLAEEVAEDVAEGAHDALYRDPSQPAVDAPGAIPPALQAFARAALDAALTDPHALARTLGQCLTEPKPGVWFDAAADAVGIGGGQGVALDRRTKMMYDERHVFINGEGYRAAGRDAALMRRLADNRALDARTVARASGDARDLLSSWAESGWLHPTQEMP